MLHYTFYTKTAEEMKTLMKTLIENGICKDPEDFDAKMLTLGEVGLEEILSSKWANEDSMWEKSCDQGSFGRERY